MHVFDQKPNFIQIVVKRIITQILIVKYRWPISLKQEILYIIIKSYLAQIYKNTSNQIYIQLGSKCFEFFVSLKIYLLNQSEINRNMICYPSFNQSYSQLDDFFLNGYSDFEFSMLGRVRRRGCSRNSNSDGVRSRLYQPTGRIR